MNKSRELALGTAVLGARQFGCGPLRLSLRAGFLEKREKRRTPSCFAQC